MTSELIYVVGLNDNTDGNAYQQELHTVELADAFTTSIEVLTRCDHVCVIDIPDYDRLTSHTIADLAPLSINISVGIYAKQHNL